MNFARIIRWVVLALMIMTGSVALPQKIKSDFNPNYNSASLKKFAFAPMNPKDPLSTHPEVAEKIRADLKTQLEKIGMQEDDTHPDFLVAFSASKQTSTSTYSSPPTSWTSQNEVWTADYTVGTLVSDFLDPSTKQPFWRGTATETVYAGTLQKYIPKGVQKLIEAFQKDAEKQRKEAAKDQR